MFVKESALPRLDQARLMVQAQKTHGVSVAHQTLEIVRLQKGRTGLTPYEYFYYGLYNPAISWEKKLRYAGEDTCRAVYLLANEMAWWQAAEDKLAFHAAMTAQGYRTPKLYAVASRSRRFGGVANLTDGAALLEWLKSAPTPLFGKPVLANHGVGGLQIKSIDKKAGTFVTDGGETHSFEALAREVEPFLDAQGYLFQEALGPHPAIDKITHGRVSTIRIVVLLGAKSPAVHRIICRIPAGPNRVDNFRRPGNLIGMVDPATGAMDMAVRGVGPDLEVMQAHPDSQASLQNVQLPSVQDAVSLALAASSSFPGIHMQSWDIALCPDGPVALEMNPGGNLNLVQLATGEGALTPDFQAFVRWCADLKLNTQVSGRELALKRAA